MNGLLGTILEANPASSNNEITEAISNYVEECVIHAVKTLPPPRIPSPAQARLRNMVIKRRKKNIRARTSSYESSLDELYDIRRDLNGHLADGTAPVPMLTPSDLDGIDVRVSKLAMDDTLDGQLGREVDSPIGSLDLAPTFQPYSRRFQTPIAGPEVRGVLEPTVSNLVTSDPVFELIAKSVESEVRSFASQKNLPMRFDFLLGKDPEYPNWKRYVLRLDTTLDFDSKMNLWTEIDARVREDIRILHQTKPELAERIEQISLNLFIHMEL